MTYELAKELKDAGFPNIRFGEFWAHGLGAHSDTRDDTPCGCNEDRLPTLSELIEACGLELGLQNVSGRKVWQAWKGLSHMVEVEGSTPEEAAAHLWLALNKKGTIKG